MNLLKYNHPLQAFSDHLFNTNIADFVGSDFVNNRPSVNIVEDEKSFRIELAAPGRDKDAFNINVDKDQLTISVNKKEEVLQEKEKFTRREFAYTSFERSFNLSDNVDKDNISASYKNGVLIVTLLKKEEHKAVKRNIEIS